MQHATIIFKINQAYLIKNKTLKKKILNNSKKSYEISFAFYKNVVISQCKHTYADFLYHSLHHSFLTYMSLCLYLTVPLSNGHFDRFEDAVLGVSVYIAGAPGLRSDHAFAADSRDGSIACLVFECSVLFDLQL